MLKKEHEILRAFVEKPWKPYTFQEIKGYANKTSDSYIFSVLKKFVNEGILKEARAGNVVLYSLRLDSEKALSYAGIVAEHLGWNRKQLPYREIEGLMGKMPTDFFILLVTGSYAKNKQRKDSDLDIAIICDDKMAPKMIHSELHHYADISAPKIDFHVFRRGEFLKMLTNKEANFGKETANNNLILAGGHTYFKILSEAIKNGFTG